MLSSGVTGLDTSSDSAITLIANSSGILVRDVTVFNSGTVAGFISIDAGTTWIYMPAGPSSRTFNLRHNPNNCVVQAKRIASGSNMTGLFADAY